MNLSPQVCSQLLSGKKVNKISHLSNGRMGSVYKIELENKETICIKVLTKNHYTKLPDSNGWKCVYEHLDFDFKTYEDKQYFYFTAPYFKGSLFHYSIQYSLRTRLKIARNLIKAIMHIHSKDLIHRDLKCNNIIVDKEEVYIIDFGRSVNFSVSSNHDLQLAEQRTLISTIKKIFQPYTAPEYFKNSSAIGFYSDYYSIAQLFRFLIPEYSHLADEILHTEIEHREKAFIKFSDLINEILKENKFNPKFNEPDKTYSNTYIILRKVLFFICQILEGFINLFRTSATASKNISIYNNHKNIALSFFSLNNQNLKENLAGFSSSSSNLHR